MLSEQEFRSFVSLASIPLREMRGVFPVGISSGCFIEYRGNHWLLAVAHSTGDMGDWAIEVGFERGRGTELYRIGPMSFVTRGDLSGVLQDLDMAYAKVPVDLQPRWQPTNERGEIVEDKPRLVLRTDLHSRPREDGEYGFSGNVQPTDEMHRESRYFGTTAVTYIGLRFAGEENEFYLFRFSRERPSDEFLKGTSGAPICDREGGLVALVCGPGKEPDSIRGIKMSYFQRALDIESARANGVENP